MAKYSPPEIVYKIINKIEAWSSFLFWIVFMLSMTSSIVPDWSEYSMVKETIDLINILSILAYFVLEVIADFILVPDAEQKRRDDFIDNSFGTKYLLANSVDYYDNEEVPKGLYKAAVNLFENIFFTSFLIKKLTVRKIVLPALVLSSISVFAFYGFSNVPIALTVLQVFFSTQILGTLIKHLILLSQLESVLNMTIALFKHPDLNIKMSDYGADFYRIWLRYEMLINRMHPGIPDKIFKQHNAKLMEEWKNIKLRFSIQ